MTNLDKILDEIEERANSATEGPWIASYKYEGPVGYESSICFATGPKHRDNPRKDHWQKAQNDSIFIAASRTEVPKLVKALRCATQMLNGLKPALSYAHTDLCDEYYLNCLNVTNKTLKEIEQIMAGDK